MTEQKCGVMPEQPIEGELVEGELVDEDAETLALHGAAMRRLNEAFASSDQRITRMREDGRTLSRALIECMEIRTLKARREFVLSVFQKLNDLDT